MKKIKNLILLITLFYISYINNLFAKNKSNKYNYTKMYGNIKNTYQNNKNYNNITLGIKSKTKNKKKINSFSIIEGNIKTYLPYKHKFRKLVKNLNVNLSYIGLCHNKWGSISYGKNKSVIMNTLSDTDIFSNTENKFIKKNLSNNFIGNVITYKKKFNFLNNKIIKNLTITAQYQGKNNLGKNIEGILNSTDYAFGYSYDFKSPYNIKVKSSYFNSKHPGRLTRINNIMVILNPDKNSKIWSTSIKYNKKNFYIATTYSKGINFTPVSTVITSNYFKEKIKKYGFAKISNNITVALKYKFNSGITPIFGYVQTSIDNLRKIKIRKDTYIPRHLDVEKFFNIGLKYKLNKFLNMYIDYKINKLKINKLLNVGNQKEENLLSIGFIYKF